MEGELGDLKGMKKKKSDGIVTILRMNLLRKLIFFSPTAVNPTGFLINLFIYLFMFFCFVFPLFKTLLLLNFLF